MNNSYIIQQVKSQRIIYFYNLMNTLIMAMMMAIIMLIRQAQSQCPTYYSAVSLDSSSYCIKCDTTCATCSGYTMGSCITCPTDFTFVQETSYCLPPSTRLINTIQSSYKFYGFQPLNGWSGGTSHQCNGQSRITILGAAKDGTITRTHTLSPHYKLRLMVSLWWLSSSATSITVNIGSLQTQTVSPPAGALNNSNYCSGSKATNLETAFDDFSATSVAVSFTSSSDNPHNTSQTHTWGIREYIFIEYKCDTDWCSACTGPQWNDCTACVDPKRTVYSGECRCNPTKTATQHYFKHPLSNYCVMPCPNRPSGRWYGDPDTQQCVATCPLKAGTTYGMTFAEDVKAECVPTCAATNMQGLPYYHDLTNRKCVTNCPSTEPYKFNGNRTCLASCPVTPTQYYKYDKTMTCVTECPNTDHIRLFRDTVLGKCVDDCQGDDWWADYNTGYCVSDCVDHSSVKYFQDNTTTRNRCTAVCQAPLYFGDIPLGKCIDHCYGGRFGDTLPSSSRHCVQECSREASGDKYYGLLTDNRACVTVCPDGTWGEQDTYTCALTPQGCEANKYADNLTHLCVGRGLCSDGQFSTDTDRTCVIYCPDDTYANTVTMHCETGCTGLQFADPSINRCVTTCFGHGLYSDVSSGNKCVERCNQTGTTPFRDFSTKKCVAKCPDIPYLFSDPDAEDCVYNCSVGRYKDDITDPTDKVCTTNCPSPLWGSNTTGFGECVTTCPEDPPLFGDIVDSFRVCIEICAIPNFGDQDPTGNRECIPTCTNQYFAQNDTQRRCVLRCKTGTYGDNFVCHAAEDCPPGKVGDDYTNLCTSSCSVEQGTFADDIQENICVSKCPINDSVLYFADPSQSRWCKNTCNATALLFGNNNTQTCQPKCIDFESFADAQHPNRYCIAVCTHTANQLYYRNNETKTCVVPMGCQDDYFADNATLYCVRKCTQLPGDANSWGDVATKTCVEVCQGSLWGDDSSGIPLCVSLCPQLPAKWSYDPTKLCVQRCPEADNLYGQDFTRTCVGTCPQDPNDATIYTYAYDVDRTCVLHCPDGYYSDKTAKRCWSDPQDCSYGWGDDYDNTCNTLCNGHPWNTYGDDATFKCESICTAGTWADNHTGTRTCVNPCPGTYDNDGISTGLYDTYGDDFVHFCVEECVEPNTWADWQTHRCQSRCSGDGTGQISTFSENNNMRCVIALTCPFAPDKLYGDNNTRSCVTTCLNDGTITEWAENITRQCVDICPDYTNGTTNVVTRFYGDISTQSPICVIACPESPRLFGENITHQCVLECPDNTYGDQTGNRSCVDYCPNIGGVTWFTQITQQLCVKVCEDGTWGNYHDVPRPHCQTVPTDCISTQYADSSTHLCVPLCPESQNYFGDPSTKLCVDRCPTLLTPVVNVTAGINMVAGILFADYSNRLCVYRCSQTHGPRGTFGDNDTNTCVHRCPTGSYGDAQTANRHCVEDCTPGTFADDLTNTCVSQCPASPPTFGQKTTWKCVTNCPVGQWADTTDRTCETNCPAGQFRLTDDRRECVDVCPSVPDLYGDEDTWHCVSHCVDGSAKPYADPISRKCVDNCSPLFEYDNRCVLFCPEGYYSDSNNECVIPTQCDDGTYGDNATTKCISPCVGGAFADPNSRHCIAVCPDGWYGDGTDCVQTCQTAGTSISTISQLCESSCPQYTYHEDNECKATCVTGYANDDTGTCAASCPSGLYADPTTHDCVETCPDHQTDDSLDYFRNPQTGFCVTDCHGTSTLTIFKDFITGNCVQKCSLGYWGDQNDYICIPRCVDGQYGFESATERTCYLPSTGHAGLLFGDPISGQYVAVCPTAPTIYYGDTILHECKTSCAEHDGTKYYGDPSTRQCQSTCQNATHYSADPSTGQCEIRCSVGSYRFNDTPICETICPVGFADNTTRICVEFCPVWDDTFGYINTTSTERICVDVCPATTYAEPVDRTCAPGCDDPYFAYDQTHQCVTHCLDSFADLSNRKCVDQCASLDYPFADNSTNTCVDECPSDPDYFGDSNVCVFYCTTAGYYADPDSRLCVPRCPTLAAHQTYGDPLTGRCVQTCSLGYYGDKTTNLCVQTCPAGQHFAYNETRECVSLCPADQGLYGDRLLHICAYTCSSGYFGSQVTQQCVQTCQLTYWGDPLTTLCTQNCPSKIYSYGENVTRKCVASCVGYTGYADNHTRLCTQFCQDSIIPETYRDHDAKTCVEICPNGFYMQNSTNECLQDCLTGYADNYSRYCVVDCPDDPQSYADETNKICVYECLYGEFSDNSTNHCVVNCPTNPDYFGDPHTGRCVLFCTEGSYAYDDVNRRCVQHCPTKFADNLTRRCMPGCPPSQGTFADGNSNKCVRVCPENFWADNSTQTCVGTCPVLTGPIQTYSDIISKFCVLVCPDPYFGRSDTHQCVQTCPSVLNMFGHPRGRICVDITNCYQSDGIKYFADDTTQTCVQKCPLNRWADMALFKCVSTCPPGFYRNLHTQVCVDNCPTDPDEYADPLSLNCVRTCQDGYYAVVQPSGMRICVTNCKPYNLIKDSTTNRCVDRFQCATKPYLYGDWDFGACVQECTVGFADNSTQTCVTECPSSWEYFGDITAKKCVSLCDDLYADTAASRTCQLTCTDGYFADAQTSTCVQHCSSIKPYYYEDLPSKTCVDVCPGESYGYNFDQTCVYTTTGISGCPPPSFADPISRMCVQLCPMGSFAHTSTRYCVNKCTGIQYADPQRRACVTTCSDHYFALNVDPTDQKCVQFCPQPYFAENSTHSCVLGCSSLLALKSTRSCENYCPQPYFADSDNNRCVLDCNPKFADSVIRQCITPCTAPSYSDQNDYVCVLLCPENTFGRNGSRLCETTCEAGSFSDPYLRVCVASCSSYPILFADSRTNQCLPECSDPLFAYTEDRTCVSSCPNASGLIFLADTSNRKCVLECVNEQISYADYENNQCTDFCPSGTFASNLTKECVATCPTVPVDTFADIPTRVCVSQCQVGYGDPDLLTCVSECTLPRFADPTTKLCVLFCPAGYFAQTSEKTCRQTCLPNTYADSSTHQCVTECPAIQDLFKHHETWTCVDTCPPTFYAKQETRECVPICQSTSVGLFAYQLTNQCLMECPVPYRGFQLNHTCILNCPASYFYNITRNVCTRCPAQCTACTGPYSCLSCISSYNLFNGVCSFSCIPQNNIITYSHPVTNQCTQKCPFSYFGDNSTYSCTQTCPNKQYGNQTTQLCEDCPATCSLCFNTTYCTDCQPNAIMAIDNMCYTACNATHTYSYNNQCYERCPSGTYITYTNVHCGACSSLCLTCHGAANNCTSCYDRYYYNFTCLSKCPDDYYGRPDLICALCEQSTTNICSEQLSFTTRLSIENYQYVISMEFNQEVDIKKQIDQILKVKLKVKRRMLDIATLINDGISYTYEILSNGTIKLYLNIQTDIDNPTFEVQITDPTAIISKATGATLQDTNAELIAEQVEYYPKSAGSELGIIKVAQFTVIFLLVLFAITILLTDAMIKPIQLAQLMFFHCLTVSPIPASLFFYLLQLRLSLMQFLPNWLSDAFISPDITLHQTSTRRTIDIFVDYNFTRNVGQIVFIIVIYFALWAIFMVISNRRIIEHRQWHSFLQTISKRKFRWAILNDIFGMFYMLILWFGFMQFQELFNQGYLGFNGFMTLVFVIMAVLMPFGWLYVCLKKQQAEIQENFGFLNHRLTKQNAKAIFTTFVSYLHLLFCCVWLVGLTAFPTPQMILLIVTNIAYIIFLIVVRPYLIHINLISEIIVLLMIVVLECFIVYFYEQDSVLNSTDKTNLIYPFLIAMSVILILMIVWSVWRCIWQIMDIWKFFKKTEFFKKFGDPEIEEQKEESEHYEKYQKIAQNIEPTVDDIVIQKIQRECNEQGENVIKVRKKVLRKKKKQASNRRKNEQQAQEEQNKEFVRINKVNPFDYDYDEHYQIKQNKDPMKRTFDDDLRDIVSDEEQESKNNNRNKAPAAKKPKEDKINLQIEDNEEEINDLDDIGASKAKKDKTEYPFQFLDGFQELESDKKSEHISKSSENSEVDPNYYKNPDDNKNDEQKKNDEQPQQKIEQKQESQYERADIMNILEDDSEKKSQQSIEADNKSQKEQKNEVDEKAKSQQDDKQEQVLPKIRGIEQLLEQQESNNKKKKNLLFLFDDEDEDEEQ